MDSGKTQVRQFDTAKDECVIVKAYPDGRIALTVMDYCEVAMVYLSGAQAFTIGLALCRLHDPTDPDR